MKCFFFIMQVLPNGQRRQKANSENLAFTQITREDAGNYSCKASSLLKVSGVSVPETVYGEAFMYINVQCEWSLIFNSCQCAV